MVKARRADGDSLLLNRDLEFALSHDGRLFEPFFPCWDKELGAFVLDHPENRIYRISRTKGETSILIEWELARYQPLQKLVSPRSLRTAGDSHRLHFRHHQRAADYVYLEAGEPLKVDIKGSTRLILESRLSYLDSSPQWHRNYELTLRQGSDLQRFLLRTSPIASQLTLDSGRALLLGRAQTCSASLETNSVEITTSAAVYLRLTTEKSRFLLAGLNDSSKFWDKDSRASWWLREPRLPRDQPTDNRPLTYITSSELPDTFSGCRETALAQYHLLKQRARFAADVPAAKAKLRDFRGRFTYYRSLHALARPGFAAVFRSLPFNTSGLRDNLDEDPVYMAPRFIDRLGQQVTEARYRRWNASESLAFTLPPLPGLAMVRLLIIDPQAGEDVNLSYAVAENDLRPLNLTNRGPRPWATVQPYIQDRWEPNSGADYARLSEAGVVSAAVKEWELPEGTRHINLFRDANQCRPLWVCLQVRLSKPYRLNEDEYDETLCRLGTTGLEVFCDLLDREPLRYLPDPSRNDEAMAQLKLSGHLEALGRRIMYDSIRFSGDSDCGPRSPITLDFLPMPVAELERAKAEWFIQDGDDLTALAILSQLVLCNGDAFDRLARNELLVNLGEQYLAVADLKAMITTALDAQQRLLAFDLLQAVYQQSDDELNLGSLYALMFYLNRGPQELATLADFYGKKGQYQYALDSLLLLANPKKEQLFVAALDQGWQRYAKQALAQMDGPKKLINEAHLLNKTGRYSQARQKLAQAGEAGQPWLNALEEGQRLGKQLLSPHRVDRRRALLELEAWWAKHPGPRVFRLAAQLVRRSAGASWVYHRTRDFYADYYLATPKQPMELEVCGPAELRIEIRPRFDGPAPVNGFYELHIDGVPRLAGYTKNRPSSSWTLVAEKPVPPGSVLLEQVRLGPGTHKLSLRGDRDLLVRLFRLEPQFPVAPLPRLEPITWAAVDAGDFPDSEAAPTGIFLLGPTGTVRAFPELLPQHWPVPRPLNRQEELRCLLRQVQPKPQELIARRDVATSLPEDERPLFWQHMLDRDPERYRGLLKGTSPAMRLPLAKKKLTQAFAVDVKEPATSRERMSILHQQYQQDPDNWALYQVQALALAQTHPEVAALAAPFARMGVWDQVRTFDQRSDSARLMGKSKSTHLAVRAALVPPDTTSSLLFANQRLGVTFIGKEPAAIRLLLAVENVGSLSPEPLTAFYRWDQGEPTRVDLIPAKHWTVLDIQPPSGASHLTLGAQHPMVNQFLRLRILEASESGYHRLEQEESKRLYQVSTKLKRLTLRLFEPSWLRVEQWQKGRVIREDRFIADVPSEQVFGEGDGSSFFRVYRRVQRRFELEPALPRPLPNLFVDDYRLTQLEEPLLGPPPPRPLFEGLGRHGRMSLESELLLVNRAHSDNEDDSLAGSDRFLQIGHDWRRATVKRDFFVRGKLLARLREQGGHSVGGIARLNLVRDRYRAYAQMSSYYQFLNAQLAEDDRKRSDPYAVNTRLGFIWRGEHRTSHSHSSRVALHHYDHSVDGAQSVTLDRDLFTEYREDHRYGLSLEQRLQYNPYLDSIFRMQLALTTNEKLSTYPVDQYRLNASWHQLMGRFLVVGTLKTRLSLADSDRAHGTFAWLPGLAVSHEQPAFGCRRSLGLSLQFDARNEGVNLSFFIKKGYQLRGGYADYLPGEVSFSRLHQRRYQLERLLETYDAGTQ